MFPQTESDTDFPISPYALTKQMGEEYGRLFAEVYGLPTVALRYFNVYGPRQDLEDEYAVVIPKFIMSLLRGESPPIYGDGLQSRDFTYVEDVVAANLAACTADAAVGKAYNVACGETHSVRELFDIVRELVGRELEPRFLPSRAGDVRKTHADMTAAARDLKWKATIGFREGLEKTVAWFSKMHCAQS